MWTTFFLCASSFAHYAVVSWIKRVQFLVSNSISTYKFFFLPLNILACFEWERLWILLPLSKLGSITWDCNLNLIPPQTLARASLHLDHFSLQACVIDNRKNRRRGFNLCTCSQGILVCLDTVCLMPSLTVRHMVRNLKKRQNVWCKWTHTDINCGAKHSHSRYTHALTVWHTVYECRTDYTLSTWFMMGFIPFGLRLRCDPVFSPTVPCWVLSKKKKQSHHMFSFP